MPVRVSTEPIGLAACTVGTGPAASSTAIVSAHAGLAGGDADVDAGAVDAGLPGPADAAEGAAAVLAEFQARAEGLVIAGLTLPRVIAEAVGSAASAEDAALRIGPALPIRAVGDAARYAGAEGLWLEVTAAQRLIQTGGQEAQQAQESPAMLQL